MKNSSHKSELKQDQDWEKEFDQIMIGYACDCKPKAKAFIHSLLSSQRQRIVEEIKGWIHTNRLFVDFDDLLDYLDSLEKK